MTERRQQPPYPLRMPDSLRAKIAEIAKASGRSMNAEIVHRLEQTLGDPNPQAQALAAEALALAHPSDTLAAAAKKWAEEIAHPGQRPVLEALLATTLAMLAQVKKDNY